MLRVLRAVLVAAVLPILAFAQSADQEVVSVVDSPDPIVPGQILTYTITMTNHGPDPAVNGGLNVNLPLEVTYQNTVNPPGFTCFVAGSNVSCINPSFAVGTVQFTMTVLVGSHLLNFPDGSFAANFFPSGTTPDPNNGNNSKSATTNYDSPQVDVLVSVTDSPDPVFPDGNITYTVDVTNAGPDTATNVNFNVFNNGTLKFVSGTQPAGWTCTFPSVGGNPTHTCTRASFPPGTSQFTVVLNADDAILGINDGTVSTVFSSSGTGDDTNDPNNTETEDTAYVTPDADMAVAVTDSPDPVTPDNDITYTITVTNAGPDAAPNAQLSIFNNGTLQFQSITEPAGWTCAEPAVNAAPVFNCSNPSFANGGNSVFTLVVRASSIILGNADGTVSTAFTAGSASADPNNANNSETEDTAYVVPDADISVTNSDSPDPSTQGGTITYTQSITNNGPDPATSATFAQGTPVGTTFQSLSAPGGWSCTTPAVGGTGAISCTKASMSNGESGAFTLVVNVTGSGTISSTVTGGSATHDPDLPDNSSNATTTVPAVTTADLSITKSTAATTAPIGTTYSYTLVVTNNGPDAAANVVLTDTLPSALLFRSITQPSPFACTTPAVGASGTITCTAATLANGASRTLTLVVEVASGASGSIVNNAGVASDTSDGNGGNSSAGASAVAAAPASAAVSITKSTAASQAPVGSVLTYTITVPNAGPSPATNVIVTDDLPAGLQFVAATPSQGSCNAADPVVCNLGTIPSGSDATITLQARVIATAGTIANTASVTWAEGAGDAATTPAIPVTAAADFDAVPTLSEWALIAMAIALALVGLKSRI